jgi:putative pyruvate formate lyase activating enzyme
LGRIVATEEFAEICLALQNSGAENVNIVTGSHAVPALVEGLTAAKAQGMGIPVVWNSSGYEKPETLDLLDGLVDTWLPDLKTLDTALAEGNLGPVGPRCRVAERLFNAPNYPDAAIAAILWMLNKPGKVIIRHLILPGYLDSTRAVLRWFADNAGGKGALLSLMSQYTPVGIRDSNSDNNPQSLIPSRYLNKHEYDTVLGWLGEFGIEDGFCQDYVTGSDWLPDFNRENPFSSELSVPVWHYKREIKNEKVKN